MKNSGEISARDSIDTSLTPSGDPANFSINAVDDEVLGIAKLSVDGGFLYANNKLVQMLGYSASELQNLNIAGLMSAADHQMFLSNIKRLVGGQCAFISTEITLSHSHKTEVIIRVTISPLWLPGSDQVRQLFMVAQDTSEQNRLEKVYLSHQTRSNNLLNWSRTLQQATDYDNLLHMVRDEMRTSTGYGNVWIYTFDYNRSKYIQILSIGSNNEHNVKTNFTTLRVEGDRFLEEMVASEAPLIIDDARTDPRTNKEIVEQLQNRTLIMIPLYFLGEKRGSLGIGTFGDEGCKIPTESELEYIVSMTGHISAAIERIKFVDETRNNQIKQLDLEKKLQQSQKMEAIGQLTGGIAHDFNNILASIMGFTELAAFTANSTVISIDKLKNYLSEVMNAGTRARDLIAQMLAFSRGANSEWSMIGVETVIKETIKMLRSSLPSSFQIHADLEQNMPHIKSDVVKLNQIFMNLCINAKDATNGTGTVIISSRLFSANNHVCSACSQHFTGEFLAIDVKDNGSGIPTDIVHRVFDPFFTTKEVGRGTGMGLSMVHGIMHEHHGHILLKTSSAEGTMFTLLFPLAHSLNSSVCPENNLPTQVTARASASKKPRIMVVDDEVSVGKFLRELIQEHGYDVHIETNSQEALAAFQDAPGDYDLVITDQIMPGICGIELFENISKIRQDCPVIICTGNSDVVSESYARELGIQGYCTKPIETNLLMEQISRLTSYT